MSCAQMQFISELNGTKLYFAGDGFSNPGIYIWNGSENVRVWPQPDSAASSGDVEQRARELLEIADFLPESAQAFYESRKNTKSFVEAAVEASRRLRAIAALSAPKQVEAEGRQTIRCLVGDMKTSAGMDYYVCIQVGDKCLTPNSYRERWKAEFDVAEWDWLLNGAPEPDILQYGPDTITPSSQPVEAEGRSVIEAALAKAIKSDPNDVPIQLDYHEARIWHQAQASAYQHALEMMVTTPPPEQPAIDLDQPPPGSHEAAMVVIERNSDGTPTIWCDPEVVDLVTALNTNRLRTVASCSGHGHRPGFIALEDGRVLLVCASLDEAQKADHVWPDINGTTRAPEQPAIDWQKFPYSQAWCDALEATLRDCQEHAAAQQVKEIRRFIDGTKAGKGEGDE